MSLFNDLLINEFFYPKIIIIIIIILNEPLFNGILFFRIYDIF